MAEAAVERLKAEILARPEILEDRDVMRALVAANDRAVGENVIDLRGAAMERLEARLDRLEALHQTVIAAAYENIAGMSLIHRAVLKMLEPADLPGFLRGMAGEVLPILRVDALCVVMESREPQASSGFGGMGGVMAFVEPGFLAEYLGAGPAGAPPVLLRRASGQSARLFGSNDIASEALMQLDLGPGRLAACLAFGARDPQAFNPAQATDLLAFFGGVFGRTLRRWLG